MNLEFNLNCDSSGYRCWVLNPLLLETGLLQPCGPIYSDLKLCIYISISVASIFLCFKRVCMGFCHSNTAHVRNIDHCSGNVLIILLVFGRDLPMFVYACSASLLLLVYEYLRMHHGKIAILVVSTLCLLYVSEWLIIYVYTSEFGCLIGFLTRYLYITVTRYIYISVSFKKRDSSLCNSLVAARSSFNFT